MNGREFDKYGGGTSCVLVTSDDAVNIGIIDAGTGIRQLGRYIMQDAVLREKPIVIAFTHFHWDHIQGLPFFAPAYVKGRKISLLALGRDRPIDDLERVFSVPMQREYFPVQLSDMGANFEFICPTRTSAFFLMPSWWLENTGILAARIAIDFHAVGNRSSSVPTLNMESTWIRTSSTSAGAPTSFSMTPNTHLTNLPATGAGAIQATSRRRMCATRSGVKKLVLTHHDPDHDDSFLDEIERHAQQLFPDSLLARENMTLVV